LKRTIQATQTIYAATILDAPETKELTHRSSLMIAPCMEPKNTSIIRTNQEEASKSQLFGSLFAALLVLSISVFLLILSIGLLYVILFELNMVQILS